MGLTMAEGLVDAVKTYLDANLVAKLAALDTEYADAITLAAPVKTYKGIKTLRTIPDYPALFIVSPTQAIRPRAAYSATEVEVNSKPTLMVGIVIIDSDMETMQLRLYRYARAFVELLMEAHGAVSLSDWTLATDEEWLVDTETGTFTDSEGSPFIGEVTLGVRADKKEWT